MKNNSKTIHNIRSIVGDKYVITNKWAKQLFSEGWRHGGGEVLAVVKPGKLLEVWNVLNLCLDADSRVIM